MDVEVIVTGGTIVTIVIGIIGYFVKHTMTTVDKHDEKINNDLVRKIDYNKNMDQVSKQIKEIRDNYTPIETHNNDVGECREDIKLIKDNYLTKDDFFREQAKTDRKLDKIMDILLEMKGDR